MKKTLTKLLFGAALLLCVCSSSCGTAPTEPMELSGYTVVRSDFALDTEIAASIELRKQLSDVYGFQLPIKTDFVNKNKDETIGQYEILVGATGREESQAIFAELNPRDFVIEDRNGKLCIIGGTEEYTAKAVGYFTENYISDGKVTFPIGGRYEALYSYPKLTVAGASIGELSIECERESFKPIAERITALIYDELNVTLAESSEKKLRLTTDGKLEPGKYQLAVNNGELVISASSASGVENCAERFCELLVSGEMVGELAEGWTDSFEATLADVGEYPEAVRYFIGKTDKDPLSYKVGDKLTIDLALMADDKRASCSQFEYTISSDFGLNESGKLSGAEGGLTLSVDCKAEGSIRFKVKALDMRSEPIEGVDAFEGGAVVGFETLEQGVPEPEDFDKFWQGQLDELSKIEPTALELIKVEGDKAVNGFEIYDFKINMGDGDPVRGYLAYPTGAAPGSLSGRLVFHGYGVSATPISYSQGYLTLSVCTHSIDPGREEEYYEELKAGKLKNYGFVKSENQKPETCYFNGTVRRNVQAARYIMASELWNGKELDVRGGSQGAFQAAGVAGLLADKVTSCNLSIPWMVDIGGEQIGRLNGWHPTPDPGANYYDTLNFAKRIKCKTVINARLGDSTCPISGIVAMYNSMSCPVELTIAQNGTHSYTAPKGTYDIVTMNK